jgi:hypothetical protein
MEPLLCGGCGAPQPVGEADDVRCRGCGKVTALPVAYKSLRDAHRLSVADAAKLDALCADISRPPPVWERIAVVVGYGVGIITLVVLAIGAIIGAIGGFIVADKIGGGDTIAKIVVGIGVLFCGFVSVPFVGEWVIAFFAAGFDSDMACKVIGGAHVPFRSDLTVAGVLYFLGIVPIAIAWRTSQSISSLQELQAKLAAQPPATTGGASACRGCGAPLDARPGALATRCIFCGADNLLTIPKSAAEKKKADATAIDREVEAAIAAREATKRSDRTTMWTLLAAGLLVAPVVCAGGWLLHAVLKL